jgi:uncharacterized membrane protein YoaK (UPF0700 family)
MTESTPIRAAGSILLEIDPSDDETDEDTANSMTTTVVSSSNTNSDESHYYRAGEDLTQTSFFQLPVPTVATTTTTSTQISSSTRPIITQDRLDTRFLIAMMGMAGYVEGFCLLSFGTFPNMMTGNTVKLVEAMLYGRWNKILYFSSMILLYMVGGSIFVQWKDYANTKTTLSSSSFDNTPPISPAQQLVEYRSTLTRGVALLSMGTLIASDLLFGGIQATRLPLLGMAFGILHAYAIDLIGVIPFAMTGHLTKIGIGLTKDYILGEKKSIIKEPTAYQTTPQTPPSTPRYNPRGYQTSIRGLSVFMGMALLANIVLSLAAKSIRLSTLLQSRLGTTLALSYGLLLRWYDRQHGKIVAAQQHQ